jgi:hypothetical protein
VTLTKTGLSAVRTFSPLGVKSIISCKACFKTALQNFLNQTCIVPIPKQIRNELYYQSL